MASSGFKPSQHRCGALQCRQYIDAETVFLEMLRVQAEQKETRGSMFWRNISGTSYLIRESSGGAQKSLGPKNTETELIFEKFQAKKETLTQRLKSLSAAVQSAQRMNKALRVGRAPAIVTKTLNALRDAGLQDHFLTIGTHALYAYESACGVRFMPDALATQDIDLLFDSRKRLSFVSKMKKMDTSFIGALQKADPTFRVMRDQKQTAINATGFEIDVIRRMAIDADPHPFSQVIVSETGHMAVMNTIAPTLFVALKKRPKDALQATSVQALIDGYMPQYHG